MPVEFPPIESANSDGLLAVGGNLDPETLTQAYKQGIFPWPVSEEFPLTWFAPDPRGALDLKDFHIPRSLEKFLKKGLNEIKFNQDFEKIINLCANKKRKHEEGTWINQDIINGYVDMFYQGKAYCVGAYEDNELAGGLYGVCLGEIFSGESMFYNKKNASKTALVELCLLLKKKGIPFLDTQMVTPVIASMGGKEVPRVKFMQMLGRLDVSRPRVDIFGS
ncbi:MAG: leucyl/phenylalanyl-tRNA--protein transferase [Bacteriovoracaceae bacterium]